MKKFLIIGNQNALCYNEVFKLIKRGKILTGFDKPDHYINPDGDIVIGSASDWFHNLDIQKNIKYKLEKQYTPEEYPAFDFYPAINVNSIKTIPYDYDGIMAVPITALDRMCPDGYIHLNNNRYEVIDLNKRYSALDTLGYNEEAIKNHRHLTTLNGEYKYARVIIKKI